MRHQSPLEKLVDEVLIGGLPQPLKDSIVSAISKGGDPAVIQRIIERATANAPMTRAAAEAFLEAKVKEREGR